MRNRVRFDVGMDGGDDLIGFGELEKGIVEPELDAGEVEGIVTQLDGFAAQIGGDAIAVVAKGKGGGLGDLAAGAMEKSTVLGVQHSAWRSWAGSTERVAGLVSWRKRSRGD
jgi:hypothetical protein